MNEVIQLSSLGEHYFFPVQGFQKNWTEHDRTKKQLEEESLKNQRNRMTHMPS